MMETLNYILPLLLKNWLTKPDSDEQDRVEDSKTEREEVVDRSSVREVVKDEAEKWTDATTKCKEDENDVTEWKAFQNEATEWKEGEDEAAEGKVVEVESTEWKEVEDKATESAAVAAKCKEDEDEGTEWKDVEDEGTEWKDVEDEGTEWKDVEDEAIEGGDFEDEATEWKDAAAELKKIEDENTEYSEFEGNATKCKGVAEEEIVNDKVHKKGHLICKRVTDKNGSKTRKGQRAWKPLNAVLQGMVLYLQKDIHDLSKADNAIRVHHALAYPIDYKKKPHVLCLRTADLRIFYFQAASEEEQASWIAAFNCIAGFNCIKGNETESDDVDKATEWKDVVEEEESMGMHPIHKIGYLLCKRVTGENESKTRKSQRAWKPFNAVLQGMVLYLKADTHNLSKTDNAIRVHHALANPIDYKKKPHVLCLRSADRRHFYFQAESEEEQASWIATINCIAACYSAPPHIPVSHDKTTHCPQFLPSFTTHLSLEQQLEYYTFQFLKVSQHLTYYNSLPFKEGILSLGYMLQEVKRYETYVRELQKLVAAKDAGEGCSNSVTGTIVFCKQDNRLQI